MKNSSFYFSAEYKKDGYDVSNKKYFNPKYDKAIMVDLLDEVTKWLNKLKNDDYVVEIIGNGLNNNFKQRTICRIWMQKSYNKDVYPDRFTVIFFTDNDRMLEEFETKKEAFARFKELFVRLFPDQMIIEE